jgi:predicted FMN-binding regulatory protein PaiB
MGKKYQKYKISVQYLNGDIEDVNMSGINTSSFSKMLEVYHRIKNTYADKVKIINFIGIDQEGNLHIKFTKKIKQQGREELKQDVNYIANDISKKIQLLKDKWFYHSDLINGLTKKEDVKLHELEGIKKIKFISEEERNIIRLKIAIELEDIRNERRWHKDQLSIINKLQEKKIGDKEINFTHLSNIFKITINKPQMKPLNMKIAEELKIYKEEPIKDKIKQIEKLKRNFDKIIIDEADNRLICYNKAKII